MLLPFVLYLLKLFGKNSHDNNLKSKRSNAFLVLVWLAFAFGCALPPLVDTVLALPAAFAATLVAAKWVRDRAKRRAYG